MSIVTGESYFYLTFTLRIRKVTIQHGHRDGHFQTVLAILCNNVAMVPLNNLFHDGKADTGTVLALVLCPVEPLEQLRQIVRINTSAIILNDAEERGFCPLQLYPD